VRIGQAIALSVTLSVTSVACTTAAAQEQSNSGQRKGLDRILRVQTREVVHPNIERLESALSDLASDPLAKKVASDEINLARNALNNAIAARRVGRKSHAERAEQLVEAALLLASRKIARERAQTALRETKQRAVEAEKAIQRAEDELEAVMQKRAALYLGQNK
jgi:hypothetical protein